MGGSFVRQVVEPRGISRRDLLRALGVGTGAVMVLGSCTFPTPSPTPSPPPGASDPLPFPDGVMAGDPQPGGAVIWTRVDNGGAPADVLWSVATDAAFTTLVAGGLTSTDATSGHAVHVQVTGLDPDRWYWYRFETAGSASRVGRLRTAPAQGATVDHLRFGFTSCQQINDSWFVAQQAMAAEPGLDFMLHLGDYVYVSDTGTQTLDDYRDVYRRWRRQPLLRDLHAALPTVAMWDDGEFVNGIDRFMPAGRFANATRAWFEAFPVIDPGDRRLYRSLAWGALADMAVADVRSYRDPYLDSVGPTGGPGTAYDPTRTTLGAPQYSWLTSLLAGSSARWRLVGLGYPIQPWRLVNLEFLRPFLNDPPPNAGVYIPTDGWDQYMRERRDLLTFMESAGVTDTVFCSGQTHISLVSELQADPDRPSTAVVGADFVCPSMTADPDVRRAYLSSLPVEVADRVLNLGETWVLGQNAPQMKYMNLADQGYVVVDVTPEEVLVTYRFIDTYDPAATAVNGARFRVRRGSGSKIERLAATRERGSFG